MYVFVLRAVPTCRQQGEETFFGPEPEQRGRAAGVDLFRVCFIVLHLGQVELAQTLSVGT